MKDSMFSRALNTKKEGSILATAGCSQSRGLKKGVPHGRSDFSHFKNGNPSSTSIYEVEKGGKNTKK